MAGARVVVGEAVSGNNHSLQARFKRQKGSLRPIVAVTNYMRVCVHAQSCPTLGNPMDCSPPGSSVHGISQARILEWVAISFFRGSSLPDQESHSSLLHCRQILYC